MKQFVAFSFVLSANTANLGFSYPIWPTIGGIVTGTYPDSMYCPVQQKTRTAGRFGNLMELYEQNYLQLRLLIPNLKNAEISTEVSKVPGCLPLYMHMIEKSPYTTTLRLTYRFVSTSGRPGRATAEPDLMLRIYHDARTAEVVSGLIHGQQHVQRKTRGLDNSWRLNRFLYKWLRYLHFRGHHFELCQTTDPKAG